MRLLIALSLTICCAACGDGPARAIERAAVARVQAQPRPLPDLPAECRRQTVAAVAAGDRLDVALLRTAATAATLRAQIRRCAAWYDDLQAGLAAGVR